MQNSDSHAPEAPPSPTDVASEVAAFEVRLAGQPIDPRCIIVDLEVWQAVGQPPRARLTLAADQSSGVAFPTADGSGLSAGVMLTLSLGYGSALTPMFAGAVHRQGLRGAVAAPPVLTVEALGATPAGPSVSGDPVLTLAWGESVLAADLTLEAGLQGQLSFQGSALPHPGCTVRLQGFGGLFDGEVTVRECHQRMTDGMWTTDLTVERAPRSRTGPIGAGS